MVFNIKQPEQVFIRHFIRIWTRVGGLYIEENVNSWICTSRKLFRFSNRSIVCTRDSDMRTSINSFIHWKYPNSNYDIKFYLNFDQFSERGVIFKLQKTLSHLRYLERFHATFWGHCLFLSCFRFFYGGRGTL